jgi:DNA-directed RNA polymerase subunit RPC12/RpoP
VLYFVCSICRTQLSVDDSFAGKLVKCPTCLSAQRVPAADAEDQTVPVGGGPRARSGATASQGSIAGARRMPGAVVKTTAGSRYGFNCPYCSSRLEASEGQAGGDGACPTCGSEITIPILDRFGRLIDPKTRQIIKPDPHPVHAYAAAGERAPRVVRVSDGSQHIQCPKCAGYSPVSANVCRHCGTPFTIEGTSPDALGGANNYATLSLVVGIISIPAACAIIFSPIAIVLGIVGYQQAVGSPDGSGRAAAIAGIACGVIGGLLSVWRFF